MRALYFEAAVSDNFITWGHSEQGGGMNRTFIGISCNNSLPSTLINTPIVADARLQVQVDIHTQSSVEYLQNCEAILDAEFPTPPISLLSTHLLPNIPVKSSAILPWLTKLIGH